MMLSGACGFVFIASSIPIVQLAGVVVVFGLGWGWVGLFQYLLVAVNPANPGSATGITDTGGYIGVALGPIAAGVIADRASFDAVWAMAGVATLLGGAFVFAGARVARRHGAPVELRAGSATPAQHVVGCPPSG